MSSPPGDNFWLELIKMIDKRSKSVFKKWAHTGSNIVEEFIFDNYRETRDDLLVDTCEILFRKK